MLHSAHYAMRQQSSSGQNVVIGGFMSNDITFFDYFSLFVNIAIYTYIFIKLSKISTLEKELQDLKRKLKRYE